MSGGLADKGRMERTMTIHVTRGHGRLEGFLARQRTRQAHRLLGADRHEGRVLDIGCGSYPLFLVSTKFAEKYGLDRVSVSVTDDVRAHNVQVIEYDLTTGRELPFAAEFFDVVTMLAVFEHLDRPILDHLLSEVHRILRGGGLYLMTTPAHWAEGLLKVLARLGMVSHEELDEHKATYTRPEVEAILVKAGFAPGQVRIGYFEAGMNIWATAVKG
jgi:SAM-dependent methyltransferase